jgi:hypothetical protein
MTDDTEPLPVAPLEPPPDVLAKAHRVIQVQRSTERRSTIRLVLNLVLTAALVAMFFALLRVNAVVDVVRAGQARDRCHARLEGEYLATFSDYLGVPIGDPYRRQLDGHLRRIADLLRRSECGTIPAAPTPPTTTTTEPPPPVEAPAPEARGTASRSPAPEVAATVTTTAPTTSESSASERVPSGSDAPKSDRDPPRKGVVERVTDFLRATRR